MPKVEAPAPAEPTPPAPVVVAYKGFDKDLRCRGYQYAFGKTELHDGPVKHCKSGFHACENPLDMFGYYAPGTSRYGEVEMGGDISRETDGDTKIASASITVQVEIGVPVIVAKAIEWITALCDPTSAKHATGYRSASSATGDQSASSATGYRSASSATGDQSANSATGYQSASSATGDQSASSATGDQSASSATGYQSASSATGDQSASSATGDSAVALNVGLLGKARASEGGAIVLCAHDDDGKLLHIRASKVGDNSIKPDVFYTLSQTGEFVEVAE